MFLKQLYTKPGISFFGILAFYVLSILFDRAELYPIFKFSSYISSLGTTFEGFGYLPIILTFFSYLLAWVMGVSLTKPFPDRKNFQAAKIFIPAICGYFALLVAIRVLSLALAPQFLFVAIVIIAALCLWLRKERLFSIGTSLGRIQNLGIYLSLGLFFLVLFLVLQFWQSDFVWIGHGSKMYGAPLIDYLDPNQFSRLPIIGNHFDEILIPYLVLSVTGISYDPVLPMWLALGVNKVIAFGALYSAFRIHSVPRWYSFIAVLFLFFGSFHAIPYKYFLLFDASNPLGYVATSGRLMSVCLCVVLMLMSMKNRLDIIPASVLGILGLGVSFSSISNGIVMLFCFFIIAYSARIKDRSIFSLALSLAIAGFLCALTYELANKKLSWPLLPGAPLFAAIVWISMIVISMRINIPSILSVRSFLKKYLPIMLGVMLGWCLLGNLTAGNFVQSALLKVVNGISGLNIQVINEFEIPKYAYHFFVDMRERGNWAIYNNSGIEFWNVYGLIFCLPLALIFYIRRRRDLLSKYVGFCAFMLLAILIIMFFMDFVGNPHSATASTNTMERPWVKSRFMEIPVYLLLNLSMIFFCLLGTRIQRRFMAFILLILVLAPIIYTERLPQWRQNAIFLWNLKR